MVTGVVVTKWGAEVTFSFLYALQQPYQLVFHDCRELQWDVHSAEDVDEEIANLIGIALGEKGHVKAAVVTTDIFELSILYGSWEVQKSW